MGNAGNNHCHRHHFGTYPQDSTFLDGIKQILFVVVFASMRRCQACYGSDYNQSRKSSVSASFYRVNPRFHIWTYSWCVLEISARVVEDVAPFRAFCINNSNWALFLMPVTIRPLIMNVGVPRTPNSANACCCS